MIHYVHNENYLLVELSGEYSLEFFIEVVHEVAKHGKSEKFSKVLIDATKINGNPSILDRYSIGIEISTVWAKDMKASAVVREEVFSEITENVAVNRSANFRVFTKMESAVEWLHEKK